VLPAVRPLITTVAESGYADPAALARLRATRCDAVLIGEAFMTSPDPAATLARLRAAAEGRG
jgi:indole-3-glycerol phosphate synthase